MTLTVLVTTLALLQAGTAPGRQPAPQRMEEQQLVPYYLVLLKRAPAPPALSDADANELQARHIAHLEKLEREGHGMAAGPFLDGTDLRGLTILRAASADEARALQEGDPAVKAGRLVVEVIPFLSPEGWFQKARVPFEPEQLFFGFLKNGPNRAQDADTAAAIQKAHLAHLNEEAAAGRLVLAGPILLKEGDRRGVFAYRVGSLAEARARAEADPAVRAGRLTVDIHPWMTAKGVLR
jgi:uncharacterized protein YciI